MGMSGYAIHRASQRPFAEVVSRARAALAADGFGVLCEIDVQAKMKEKLGKDMPPYLILGACAPPQAFQVLSAVPDIGVFLPCNVCVYEDPSGGVVVAAIDPQAMALVVPDPAVAEVAAQMGPRLQRVVEAAA
jgi:uncharacterized protein (DUF302 family)